MNFNDLKIALDIDDCILDFKSAFDEKFPNSNWNDANSITKKVESLKLNSEFWSNLPLLEKPSGFEPHIYSTKRINSKIYTRNSLRKHGFPIKPIYQTLTQEGNKADIIKGRCDVLIDDSIFNVMQCISSGLPALLITRPHNEKYKFKFRISKLDIEEIKQVLKYELKVLGWN